MHKLILFETYVTDIRNSIYAGILKVTFRELLYSWAEEQEGPAKFGEIVLGLSNCRKFQNSAGSTKTFHYHTSITSFFCNLHQKWAEVR
jgi:hypothetical protein